jgi:ribonuclease BN (tRNA processing enzyme)
MDRREFISIFGGALASWPIGARAQQPSPADLGPNRLVFLGTAGGPVIYGINRTQPASLIVWNNIPYVIDTGAGVTLKLVEAKIPLSALRYTFITHHHSDHNEEWGLLAYSAWTANLLHPIDCYGPLGMKQLAEGFWDAYKFDIETRMADEGERICASSSPPTSLPRAR